MSIARKCLPVCLLLLASVPVGSIPAQSMDLMDVYQLALRSDPLVREAEANQQAVAAGRPAARGALLPQLTGRASLGIQKAGGSTTTFFANQASERVVDSRDDRTSNWTLELRQTVFRWDQWVRLNQADKLATQAEADLEFARQDLLIRVAEAYFNVLAAEDALASEQAAKEAIGRQLEQATKRFEVGLIAITDVQEAQAAYDQAVATEILAKRTLANQQEVLRAIIEDFPTDLAKPTEEIPLLTPDPAEEDAWVDLAMRQNLSLISSQIGVEIARDDVRIARSGHLPTLDLVAQRSSTDNEGFTRTPCVGPGCTFPTVRGPTGTDLETDSVQLQLNVPIFSGGITSANVNQAEFRRRAARERLERTARETERQTRDSYLGVISEISRVEALRQALESARTALRATEAGFDVGTRTTVDVLDTRRALFLAETNYLRSRYDYLLNGLRLQQAAGTLGEDDLVRINALLRETPASTREVLPELAE